MSMPLTSEQIQKIENNIKESLRNKFSSYKPESNNMPFHYRLLGRDRMALFSFIRSLNTTFGTSIFEPVAETLASLKFPVAQKQFVVGDTISEQAQNEIQHIINELMLESFFTTYSNNLLRVFTFPQSHFITNSKINY